MTQEPNKNPEAQTAVGRALQEAADKTVAAMNEFAEAWKRR